MPSLTPLDGLDLNLLVTLRALVSQSSVTGAAERLGTSQPTVSRSLATLREAFGDPLLVRSGRGMALTPFATALRDPLEQTLASIDRLRTVGAFDPHRDTRRFRVIVPDIVGVSLLPRLMEELERAPGLSLEVHGSERDALGALLRDEIDLVVGALPLEHAELSTRRIGDRGMAWGVVLGRRHPVGTDPLDHRSWLASDHVQLIPGGQAATPSHLDELLAARGESRRIVAHVAYLASLGPMLERSALVVSLPMPACRWLAKGRRLRVVPHPLERELGTLELRATWHAVHHRDGGNRWLRDTMHRCTDQLLRSDAVG